jgi:hypothetical protein
MLKKIILFSTVLILANCSFAQQLSFQDLKKIISLKKNEQDVFLKARNYGDAEEKQEGDNLAVTYHGLSVQAGKRVPRTLILIKSKELNMTMLEYSTYDEVESKAMLDWLALRGYKKSKQMVEGKAMFFLQSKTGFVKFFEEPYVLSDGTNGMRGTFAL